MSKAQKTILAIGFLLMALAALFPPSVYFGPTNSYVARGFLYTRDFTGKPYSIDGQKLAVEWMFLAALTAFGVIAAEGVRTVGAGFIDQIRDSMEIEKAEIQRENSQ